MEKQFVMWVKVFLQQRKVFPTKMANVKQKKNKEKEKSRCGNDTDLWFYYNEIKSLLRL